MKDLSKTAEEVGATEFSKVLENTGLDQMLSEANYTIFAPTDEHFKQYEPPEVLPSFLWFVKVELTSPGGRDIHNKDPMSNKILSAELSLNADKQNKFCSTEETAKLYILEHQ